MTLDQWLSKLYTADKKNQLPRPMADFKAAVVDSQILAITAKDRLKELDALVDTRGEKACAYSTEYRKYLREALA